MLEGLKEMIAAAWQKIVISIEKIRLAIIAVCVALIAAMLFYAFAITYSPCGGWYRFFSDPGFWGNIIGGCITLAVLYFSLKESRRATYIALHADLYAEAKRKKRSFDAISQRLHEANALFHTETNDVMLMLVMRDDLKAKFVDIQTDNPMDGTLRDYFDRYITDAISACTPGSIDYYDRVSAALQNGRNALNEAIKENDDFLKDFGK